MKINEYQVKNIFKKYELPVPKGFIISSLIEIEDKFNKMEDFDSWIAKCQIHAGGRAKSGGVKKLNSKKEVINFIKKWLGSRLVTYQTDKLGETVNQILIEEVITVKKELYLSAVVDRNICRIVFLSSKEGGVEIEEKQNTIIKTEIDPITGALPYQGREIAFKLGLSEKQINQFVSIFLTLEKLIIKYDLTLVEINPLAIKKDGNLICLDGKIDIDDNSLFRQRNLLEIGNTNFKNQSSYDTNYISLNGDIGCMVNGAGLAMATMDILKLYGGEPANFLDVGGSITKKRLVKMFKIVLSSKKVKVILVNIFGGIVKCDLIADGIIDALSEIETKIPIILRLEGNNSEIGKKNILSSGLKNIYISRNIIDAAKRAILITKKCEGENSVYFNR